VTFSLPSGGGVGSEVRGGGSGSSLSPRLGGEEGRSASGGTGSSSTSSSPRKLGVSSVVVAIASRKNKNFYLIVGVGCR